jgi:hypothetical protein
MTQSRLTILSACAAAISFAQPPVASAPEQVGSPRGENWTNYNISNSFEIGDRWSLIGGDQSKYRSDVNYGNGLRILSTSFSMFSRDGKGRPFDDFLIQTQGLGNDPYESAILRIAKNRVYRYDLTWRQSDYVNAGEAIANGLHGITTRRHLQDHDLTLFPQSKLRFFAGYSRADQNGPALSTINIYGKDASEYPLYSNTRRQQNEYRVGGEAAFLGLRLNVLHGWTYFKDDSSFSAQNAAATGGDTTAALASYYRSEPIHGRSPYWRGTLFREGGRWFAMNARMTYTAGKGSFVQDESVRGFAGDFGPINRFILITGSGSRPVLAGNATFSFFPTKRITITNQTSVNNIRMSGNNYYQEFNDGLFDNALSYFQALGIRTVSNSTEANFQLSKRLGFFGGYQYSNREITSLTGSQFDTFIDSTAASQTNTVNTGTAGLRVHPVKELTLIADGEVGRANLPIYPSSEKDFHALGARAQWKRKTVMLSAHTKANYNFNSAALTAFSSRSRNYSFDGSWTPKDWISFTGGYAKLHLDTTSGIVFFVLREKDTGTYAYTSNVHSIFAQARVSIKKRADLLVGLSSVQDLGDGRSLNGPIFQSAPHPFAFSAETFPMAFRSPSARLSIRLHQQLRWNAGYQYYGYHQSLVTEVIPNQGYRANTGYTSMSWSF